MAEIKKNPDLKQRRGFKTWAIVLGAIVVLMGVALAAVVVEHFAPLEKLKGVERKASQLVSYLGVELIPATDALARQFDLDSSNGALVNAVFKDSPAEKGGLERGDVITRFSRQTVTDVSHIQQMISQTSPGDHVKVVVDRNGRSRNIYVTLGERPRDAVTIGLQQQSEDKDQIRDPSTHTAALLNQSQDQTRDHWGITVSPLTPQLAEQFRLKERTGVMIVAVDPGGRSEKAGLQVGDLIAGVNRKKTPDISSFYAAIAKSDSVVLNVHRQGRDRYVTMDVNPALPPAATIGLVSVQSGETRKVAVAAMGESLRAALSPRFGTAAYFLIVDPKDGRVIESIPNYRSNSYDYRGYGIRAAQIVAGRQVDAVITRAIGPQGFDTLLLYNIKIFSSGLAQTAGEAADHYKKGQLAQLVNPTIAGSGYAKQSGLFDLALTGGKPENIPPMGKPEETSYTPAGSNASLTGGKPENIPPMGKPEEANYTLTGSQSGLVGGKQAGLFDVGLTGDKSQQASYSLAGGGKPGEGDEEEEEDEGGYKGIPPIIPPMGKPGANVVNIWQIAGQATAGPQVAADTTTGGKPENVPPPQAPGSGMRPENTGSQNVATASLNLTAAGQASGGMSNRADFCICPVCGKVVPHPIGVPCASLACPECGSRLTNPQSGVSAQNAPSGSGRVEICVCPNCGKQVPHPAGTACSSLACPSCGTRLVNASAGNTLFPVPYSVGSRTSTQIQLGGGGAGTSPLPGQGLGQSGTAGGRSVSSGQGGPGGYCICPVCGKMTLHEPGVPCTSTTCPGCGSGMVRADNTVPVSDQPENRPLGRNVSDRSQDKPPDITKRAADLLTVGSVTGKIAIAATGPDMNSKIAPLFDRAPYYLMVGFGSFKAVPNPNVKDSSGVGIQSAQMVVDEGAGAVIVKNISLEAMKALSELKVKVYSGVSGTAKQAVNWYENNRLQETTVGVVGSDQDEETHESRGMGMKDKQKFENRTKAAL